MTRILRNLPTGIRRSAAVPVVALGLLGTSLAQPVTTAVTEASATPTVATAAAASHAPAPKVPEGVTDSQVDNAKAIAKAAKERGLNDKAVTVALATALQESQLENINYGDRDSVGLFQQRPSQGWGTVDQIMDPEYSAGQFLDRLAQLDGWQDMRVTDAAQTVQRSGFPEAYEKWVPLATDLTPVATHK